MKIIEQTWQWINKPENALLKIEQAARTCYKSEDKLGRKTEKFIAGILKHGHESVIEHVSASIRFITNRGVTHELVRHRLCSFSQESTRYVRYLNDIEFIKPVWWEDWSFGEKVLWENSMLRAERDYIDLIAFGSKPEQAREILPNSLKTEIIVTANLREWRHIFRLRCSEKAHPQIRELMMKCKEGFQKEIPLLFD